MYPIIEVPEGASELPEALGTKPKFWFTDAQGYWTLYKEGRPGSGEHWAEKVCCEISRLLGIPHAEYELAHWKGRQGVVSKSFVPQDGRLVLGNELLARFTRDYDSKAKRYRFRQYTVRSAMAVLSLAGIAPPINYVRLHPPRSAPELFTGYLLLDALVGNQDRHHENWGLVVARPDPISLAPSFDHASSLGRNERDDERMRRLSTKDHGSSVEHYCSRATSPFFLPGVDKPLSTLEAFKESARIQPVAASHWLHVLRTIGRREFDQVLQMVPTSEMSDAAKAFALEMMSVNQRRLLDVDLPR